jgi:hypothetical protein
MIWMCNIPCDVMLQCYKNGIALEEMCPDDDGVAPNNDADDDDVHGGGNGIQHGGDAFSCVIRQTQPFPIPCRITPSS